MSVLSIWPRLIYSCNAFCINLKIKTCPGCKEDTNDTFEMSDGLFGKCNNSECRVSLFIVEKLESSRVMTNN